MCEVPYRGGMERATVGEVANEPGLYELLARRPAPNLSVARHPTTITASVETIDNDRAYTLIPGLGVLP